MGKSTHFLGQPLYGLVIKLLDKAEILEISRKNGGERYIKRFDAWDTFDNDALCRDNASRLIA